MRWNCPHCETSLIARPDLSESGHAYVRCASCSQISLIQSSVHFAEQVKRERRLEIDQARKKLDAETKLLDESFVLPPPMKKIESESVAAVEAPKASVEPPPFPKKSAPVEARAPTPPPFVQRPTPPAFLLKERTTVDSAFAEKEEVGTGAQTPSASHTSSDEDLIRTTESAPKRARTDIAVWAAAAIAAASGVYLFLEGRKAFSPTEPVSQSVTAAPPHASNH